jgi:hypothetical protein
MGQAIGWGGFSATCGLIRTKSVDSARKGERGREEGEAFQCEAVRRHR